MFIRQTTGEGILYVFNPFNGQGIGANDGVLPLGYRVKQTLLLHQPDRDFLRSILLLDHSDEVHVFPPSGQETVASVAGSTFLFTADPATGMLVGFSLAFSNEQRLAATRVWEVKLTQGSQVGCGVLTLTNSDASRCRWGLQTSTPLSNNQCHIALLKLIQCRC